MAQHRGDLIASLGGRDGLSEQELPIVELVSKDLLLLESIDAYLFTVGVFNKKRKQAYPLLASRMQVSDSIVRKLQALGLQRRAAHRQSLQDILAGLPESTSTEGGTPMA